eukprot:CAMPEP_0196654100 /NCGR_PEP_ID=MMETSP1086-20130531/3774_1 /TAXON_ID=77921 /ORGANISM="Cyanoptyche  gloeocystis , Strain SAG4.97" /LENGTH=547 /DNA_ID=CAMNT_0041985659 /DNA_START=29 /DNA_END=1673 /DNA_ORIENTATION=-
MSEESCTGEFFPCSETLTGNIFLVLCYGYILAQGSKLIADGSELLMEVLDPGIIGGFVLPVLGAFPDACIIFVSCLGPDLDVVQKQISVGVGTLAGSTTMLLTLPWAGCLWLGRCDIDPVRGVAIETVCTSKSITKTGVTIDRDISFLAKIMGLTAIPYAIAQIPAILYFFGEPQLQRSRESMFALVGFIFCTLAFIAYVVYQVYVPTLQQKRIEEARKRKIQEEVVRKFQAMFNANHGLSRAPSGEAPGKAEGRTSEESPLISKPNVASKWKGAAAKVTTPPPAPIAAAIDVKDDDEEDEKEKLSPRQIVLRSIGYLSVGTVLVSAFSDPLVDTISKLADKLRVDPFFVAFVLCPIASNASELIASVIFASRKTKKSINLTYGALYGGACMNNTLCLGIFLAMVYFRALAWDYSAEVACILVVELVVGAVALAGDTVRSWKGLIVGGLYFFSLGLVAFLQSSLINGTESSEKDELLTRLMSKLFTRIHVGEVPVRNDILGRCSWLCPSQQLAEQIASRPSKSMSPEEARGSCFAASKGVIACLIVL